jgi:chromosomal replication initiation ATPase DnaA
MAHFIAKRKTTESLTTIGYYFGRKNHTTVLWSIKQINTFLETDKNFRKLHEEFLNNNS